MRVSDEMREREREREREKERKREREKERERVRPDVRSTEALGCELNFWREVAGRAHKGFRRRARTCILRQAEIKQLGNRQAPLVWLVEDENVFRFYVAVDDVEAMQIVNRVGHLRKDGLGVSL